MERAREPAPSASLSGALLAPQKVLRGLGRGDDRAMLTLAALHGALLLPALFAATQGTRFSPLWSNPITWAACGLVAGLAWVQAIAFPAAVLSSAFGGRGDFPAARTSVALSLLPAALLLFAYWLVRLAGQPDVAGLALLGGWPIAALWSLRNLRLCLMESYRLRRPAAGAASAAAGTLGLWLSLAIGLLPFVATGLMMAVNDSYDRF